MKKVNRIVPLLLVGIMLMSIFAVPTASADTVDTRPVRTLMMDTISYNMAPKNVYMFRAKVTGAGVNQANVTVHSSRDAIAVVSRVAGRSDLYRITGVKPGVTYVTAEINSTHASIKVTVQAGLRKAHGSACRATSVIGYPAAHKFKVYLSPSCQILNNYVNGGTEEENMRKIADAMVPYLEKAGIPYVMAAEKHAVPTVSWDHLLQLRAKEASTKDCDLYFAIHSNARDSDVDQGSLIFYYSKDPVGKDLAQIIRDNYIYPDNSKVLLATNDQLIDMRCPAMTSILIETAYHDNMDDANWIKENIDPIAENLVQSICKYRTKYYPESNS